MIKKYFSPFFLITSIFILFYVFYKSELFWEGRNRNYYYFYYIFSVSLITFSISSFFFKEKTKLYLIIIISSIIFSSYISELYLTKKMLNEINIPEYKLNDKLTNMRATVYEKKTGKKYDRRSKLKFYKDYKKIDQDVVVVANPSSHANTVGLKTLPFSGISNAQTITCNESGSYSFFLSDRYGFNNPDKEHDADIIEYLVVGDSFAQGDCVSRPDDITSVLRSISNKNALNIGYGGNGPLVEYAVLKEYMPKNVKNVLWLYYEGNDNNDLRAEIKNPILLKYFTNKNFTQKLKQKQKIIDQMGSELIENEFKKKKIKLSDISIYRYIKLERLRVFLSKFLPSENQPSRIPKLAANDVPLKKIISLAKDFTNKNGANFYFIYLPMSDRYRNKNVDFLDKNLNYVKNIVNDLDIDFLDLSKEVFEKEDKPLSLFPFEVHGHYTVEGYEKVAKFIYNSIK